MNSPAETRNDRWPPQIKFIVGNEAAERFSFYGMRSILALYITTSLLQSKDRATTIIHFFVFASYFMPLFGAWISDRFWGRYRTILWISLFYCAGHGVLAFSDLFTTVDAKLICLYTGLGLIAFGAGGIKPCVSAFMGDQFGPDQGHLMRKAYGAFYFSINFGSFFSFIVIPWIAAKPDAQLAADAGTLARLLWQIKQAGFTGYGWAFGVPGILMGLATLIFWLGTKHYVRKPPTKETRTPGFFTVFFLAFRNLDKRNLRLTASAMVSLLTCVILPLAAMVGMVFVALRHDVTPLVRTVGWVALTCLALWYLLVLAASFLNHSELPDSFWSGARGHVDDAAITAARSVAPILAVLAFVPPFWALFDQSNSTWVLQGAQMQPFTILAFKFSVFGLNFIFNGFTIGAEEMQSCNPLLVMVLVPLLNWGLYPLLEARGLRATALRRMSAGLILTAASYVIVGWLQHRIEAGESVSLAWQAVSYLILTTGEVLVSTTGLEFAYTQAAPSMKSTIMSFWLLTVALGSLLVTTITQLGGGHGDESVSSGRFYLYAGMTAVVTVLFILIAARYRYRDETVPSLGRHVSESVSH